MKLSQHFTKTTRTVPADEVSRNGQLLIQAGYVQKVLAGVYSYLPFGLRVLNKVATIVREEMDAIGGQEVHMPALQPKENWETTGRWDSLDVLFKVDGAEGAQYALGPTHEEIVVPLALPFIQSYRDLPFAVYQIQWKFRKEARAKSGLLRGREFLMKDLYSYHEDEADLERYYEVAAAAYEKTYKRMGLSALRVAAGGGTFSKYSDEYQVLTPAGEDDIFICTECNLTINNEVVENREACPKGHAWSAQRGAEVGNIFRLKTKYTAPVNGKFLDAQNQQKDILMGCYGIGVSRLVGVLAEVFNDDAGLKWPMAVAPFHVHLATLGTDEAVLKASAELYDELRKAGVEVLWDDREQQVGAKLKDADLIGIPIRIIVSEKSLAAGGVEWKLRGEEGKGNVLPRETALAKIVEMVDLSKS